jgi:thiol-disulfide isomerase/thioredoxin
MLGLYTLFFAIFIANAEDKVTVFDDENFTDELKGVEALVLFYDPNCGSSLIALEEFKKASEAIEIKNYFKMGIIDTKQNVYVPRALKFNTSPKLVYFTSTDHYDYALPITSANILKYVDYMLDPQLPLIKPDELKEFLIPEIISFVLFDEQGSKLEWKIARSLRFHRPLNIGICPDPECVSILKSNTTGFYAINPYHDIEEKLSEFNYESILNFVIKRDIHKKISLNAAYDFVIERGLPAVYLFRNEKSKDLYDTLINETVSELDDLRIVFGDLNNHLAFGNVIGYTPSIQPAIMLIEPIGNSLNKYIPSSSIISKENILQLISDWRENKATKYYKTIKPVPGEAVGSDFTKKLENLNSDALVHFYAPWCKHCENLQNELEKAVKNVTHVKILRINAYDNEVPGHIIEEYPTLKFYYSLTKKWFEFHELDKKASELELWERVSEFVRTSRRDKKSGKTIQKQDL